MAAGISAAHGDQDIVGRHAPMQLTSLDQPMRTGAMLVVVFAVAEFAD